LPKISKFDSQTHYDEKDLYAGSKHFKKITHHGQKSSGLKPINSGTKLGQFSHES